MPNVCDQRGDHGDEKGRKRLQGEHGKQRHHRETEIDRSDAVERSDLGELHHASDRDNHDRAKRSFRKVIEETSHEERNGNNHNRTDDARHLGRRPGADACTRLGETGTDGESLEESRAHVGGAETDELLVDVDTLAFFRREGAIRSDQFGECHQHQANRAGNEFGPVIQRDIRDHRSGETGGDVSDHIDAPRFHVQQRRIWQYQRSG